MTRRASRDDGEQVDPVAEFAGSIAHDFSNLLLTIQGAAELLRDDLGAGDPRRERIDQLLHAADQASQLTRQLQAFGRAQVLKPESVKPGHVIRGMAELLRRAVPEDVEFDLAVHASGETIHFDPEQLKTVVYYLVAAVASRVQPRGRVTLTVAKETEASGDVVAFILTAEGIATSGSESLGFEPRLSSARSAQGTDLRLASVQGVVTQSGGRVESSSAAGSVTNRIVVPLSTRSGSSGKLRRAFRVAEDLLGTEVVFVVEDDESVRDLVRLSLERYGYTVYVAADGAEALRIADMFSASPDLLLTDLVMPEVTGHELVKQLGSEGRLAKVLLMSGYPGEDAAGDVTKDYPFIQKPFTHLELARKVREVLDA